MSVEAYILIQTDVAKSEAVVTACKKVDDVQSAEVLSGPYDVIVRAEKGTLDELNRLVLSHIQSIDGVTRTLTCPIMHL